LKPLRAAKRLKDPRDLWLFIQILVMLVLLPRLIRRKSIPDLLEQIDPGVGPGTCDPVLLEKTVGFTDTLIRYRIFQRYGKCLLRSVILFRFLRSQGWPVEIHFGVRKTAEGMDDITGHSWLVMDGQQFLEDINQMESYMTTYAYPA